jgi:hypothetical protein
MAVLGNLQVAVLVLRRSRGGYLSARSVRTQTADQRGENLRASSFPGWRANPDPRL